MYQNQYGTGTVDKAPLVPVPYQPFNLWYRCCLVLWSLARFPPELFGGRNLDWVFTNIIVKFECNFLKLLRIPALFVLGVVGGDKYTPFEPYERS